MNTTKYLLAKYIPDLHRVEPRNIGVIVWSSVGVEARFLAEIPDRPGEVDGRSVPQFVSSTSAYKQWIRYWRNAVSGETFKPAGGGDLLSVASPEFVAALQLTGQGNFVLAEAGQILDRITEDDLPVVADQLFASLVESNASDEPRDLDLDEVCDQLIQRTKLTENKNFHTNYPVRCDVRGVEEEYVFSHAYANGKPERLYQRVSIPRRKTQRTQLRKNVHDTTWSLEQVFNQKIVQPDKAAVLVYVTPEQEAQTDVERSLRLLRSMVKVINLRDEQVALKEFEDMAKLPQH